MFTLFKKYALKVNEGVAGLMLAALFFTFLIQIISRYIFTHPFSWTLELCLSLWLWLVFWGNSFIVRYDEHISFDVIYTSVSHRKKIFFSIISHFFIIIVLAISFNPTLEYIDFMSIRDSALLKIPINYLYSVYMIFLVMTILTFAFRIYRIIRYRTVDFKHQTTEIEN